MILQSDPLMRVAFGAGLCRRRSRWTLHVVAGAASAAAGLARVARCCAVVRRGVTPVGGTRVCNGRCRAAVRVPDCSTGRVRLRVETSFDSGLDLHGVRLSHVARSNAYAASRAEKRPRNRGPAVPVAGTLCVTGTFETARATAASRAEPAALPRRGRNGTANVFMFVDVSQPSRHAKVTDQRTCIDFAECMRDLVDEHYPDAERIRVVLDNLSAHSAAALYQAFEPAEARRSRRHSQSEPDPQPPRVPLLPQARQLAQHGRDRNHRSGIRHSAASRSAQDFKKVARARYVLGL